MNSKTVLRVLRAIHTPGLGLNSAQMLILAELANRPGISMLDLGRRCRRPGRSIERPIAVLERAGYVGKASRGSAQAGCPLLLTLTPLGLELLRGLELAVAEPTPRATP